MSTRTCPHGERQERAGTSKRTGLPYRGLFCVVNTCQPVWLDADTGAESETWESRQIQELERQIKQLQKNNHAARMGYAQIHQENEKLQRQIRKLVLDRAIAEEDRKSGANVGAVYSDKVAKLLNLAVAASTDGEASAAFAKARSLHAKEVSK